MLYLIQEADSDAGPIKVGISTRTAESRLKELQTGNPRKLRILKTIATHYKNPKRMEGKIHKNLAAARIPGTEWFAAGPVKEFFGL